MSDRNDYPASPTSVIGMGAAVAIAIATHVLTGSPALGLFVGVAAALIFRVWR